MSIAGALAAAVAAAASSLSLAHNPFNIIFNLALNRLAVFASALPLLYTYIYIHVHLFCASSFVSSSYEYRTMLLLEKGACAEVFVDI